MGIINKNPLHFISGIMFLLYAVINLIMYSYNFGYYFLFSLGALIIAFSCFAHRLKTIRLGAGLLMLLNTYPILFHAFLFHAFECEYILNILYFLLLIFYSLSKKYSLHFIVTAVVVQFVKYIVILLPIIAKIVSIMIHGEVNIFLQYIDIIPFFVGTLMLALDKYLDYGQESDAKSEYITDQQAIYY